MQSVRYVVAAGAFVLATSRPCVAQSTTTDQQTAVPPARQVNFDLSAPGLNVGFAVRSSSRTSIGASIGVGGNWLNYMALAGSHFAESGGLSYEERDGSNNKRLFELLRAGVFVRRYFDQGRELELGLKASGFLHFDSSDDEPGGGAFVGLNVTGMWWRWHRLQLGSELDAGRYSEGRPELGVNIAPILARISIP